MSVVIIGNGIAGSTAARSIRRHSNAEIIMISEETEYPFSRTALMYIFMGHMKWDHTLLFEKSFWKKNKIQLIHAKVNRIDTSTSCITLSGGENLSYDQLIIATGSNPVIPEQHWIALRGVQCLYHRADLIQLEARAQCGIRHAVIAGGGLIGIELAEMLHSRGIPTTFLVRENSYWGNVLPEEESFMISRHIRSMGIDLKTEEEIDRVEGLTDVQAVITKKGEKINCDFVGITMGVHPQKKLAVEAGIECNIGILVDEYLRTSDEKIFAIGDCAELRRPAQGRRAVEAVWFCGRTMGTIAAANICGQRKQYKQGIWFNAAKFFNIEYHVYGYVPVRDDTTESLFWMDDAGIRSIRLVYDKQSCKILGFNLMGIRYRHELCEFWIENQTNLREVVTHLPLANFDPEFSDSFEIEILQKYNQQFNDQAFLLADRRLDDVAKYIRQKQMQ
ncbi:MAG: NAD(P)/FAD-dependent oxidoreductase [Saprospiraceae bacterium]|nr:NAD(P)/FAD-dependent oxidoreductase [Saprospiraceae bacterium]HMW39393.1 FAD/NAD(P)-binding oxidoreductase [Saprospiraceae bacterium]HMX89220.1 FAD/NAD(P)-binding oxidoreductase [Saprospiraceae bacterium]HMZ41156.1 FAD/NAD(P)-binding oxidoreductase [Saprospiraceae bacterium]HNA64350.1 FAD/NAD(P)-binding oxidoreductase [Saprospiraceae bacterium]